MRRDNPKPIRWLDSEKTMVLELRVYDIDDIQDSKTDFGLLPLATKHGDVSLKEALSDIHITLIKE